jgi:hypothetical protein
MGLLGSTTAQSYYASGNSDNYGNYQFITIKDIINNFMVAYVGEGKLIPKVKRTDVAFHAQRAIQELSFDTLPSTKAIEIDMGASLAMTLPQDFVNYVKLSWHDDAGVERILYPTRQTSNPDAIIQDANDGYTFDGSGNLSLADKSETLKKFEAASFNVNNDELQDLTDSDIFNLYRYGNRYGISPENAQGNGVFYIDQINGVIRFSSNLSGRTVTLKYISDGLATDSEMQVHKFAEEAIYKYLVHAILNVRANIPEYQINRYKKELRAAKRNAKLRLSNIKIAELAQVMRNQSKWIKH